MAWGKQNPFWLGFKSELSSPTTKFLVNQNDINIFLKVTVILKIYAGGHVCFIV